MSIYFPDNFSELPDEVIELVFEYGVPSRLWQGNEDDPLIAIINQMIQNFWKAKDAFPIEANQANLQNYPVIQTWINKNGCPTTKNIHKLFLQFSTVLLQGSKPNDSDISYLGPLIDIRPDFYKPLEQINRCNLIDRAHGFIVSCQYPSDYNRYAHHSQFHQIIDLQRAYEYHNFTFYDEGLGLKVRDRCEYRNWANISNKPSPELVQRALKLW